MHEDATEMLGPSKKATPKIAPTKRFQKDGACRQDFHFMIATTPVSSKIFGRKLKNWKSKIIQFSIEIVSKDRRVSPPRKTLKECLEKVFKRRRIIGLQSSGLQKVKSAAMKRKVH